jgi:hypothetical protein
MQSPAKNTIKPNNIEQTASDTASEENIKSDVDKK